jgi:hypothetical protein
MPVRFDLSALPTRRSMKFVLAVLIAIGVIALAPLTARTWRSEPGAATTHDGGAARQTPTTAPSSEPLGYLLITIRPTGFDPEEIVHAKGEILLAVDNRSDLEAADLQLEAENGDRLHAKRVPREQLDWREIVYLNPGTYLLKETSHPDWVCRIRITNE